MQKFAAAQIHEGFLQMLQVLVRHMVLVPCLAVDGSLHEGLPGHIQFSQAVDYDMYMNVAAAVVTVHVGADQRLMPRKVGFYIFHTDGLRLFTSQSTLVFVGRIEADEVVVRLDFIVILILVVLRIKHFALHIKKFRLTVYALQKNISAEYPVPVCIQQGFLQNFVMLIFQIVECRAIVCTFARDVF